MGNKAPCREAVGASIAVVWIIKCHLHKQINTFNSNILMKKNQHSWHNFYYATMLKYSLFSRKILSWYILFSYTVSLRHCISVSLNALVEGFTHGTCSDRGDRNMGQFVVSGSSSSSVERTANITRLPMWDTPQWAVHSLQLYTTTQRGVDGKGSARGFMLGDKDWTWNRKHSMLVVCMVDWTHNKHSQSF